jgi:hypothetical protein
MIVVTAMPVVNAKTRTITTKIVFMTFALYIGSVRMAEPAGRSVIGATEDRFSPYFGGPLAGGSEI